MLDFVPVAQVYASDQNVEWYIQVEGWLMQQYHMVGCCVECIPIYTGTDLGSIAVSTAVTKINE